MQGAPSDDFVSLAHVRQTIVEHGYSLLVAIVASAASLAFLVFLWFGPTYHSELTFLLKTDSPLTQNYIDRSLFESITLALRGRGAADILVAELNKNSKQSPLIDSSAGRAIATRTRTPAIEVANIGLNGELTIDINLPVEGYGEELPSLVRRALLQIFDNHTREGLKAFRDNTKELFMASNGVGYIALSTLESSKPYLDLLAEQTVLLSKIESTHDEKLKRVASYYVGSTRGKALGSLYREDLALLVALHQFGVIDKAEMDATLKRLNAIWLDIQQNHFEYILAEVFSDASVENLATKIQQQHLERIVPLTTFPDIALVDSKQSKEFKVLEQRRYFDALIGSLPFAAIVFMAVYAGLLFFRRRKPR